MTNRRIRIALTITASTIAAANALTLGTFTIFSRHTQRRILTHDA